MNLDYAHFTDQRGVVKLITFGPGYFQRLGMWDAGGEGNPDFQPGKSPPLKSYPGVLATDEPWLFLTYTTWKDDNDNRQYGYRWIQANLTIDARLIEARMSKPAGLPVGWAHEIGGYCTTGAIGRVASMEVVKGGKLQGELLISPSELTKYMVASTDDLDKGVNAGLSIGFLPLEEPTVENREGTREKPDLRRYGKVRVFEVSLTPLPMLSGAGIIGATPIKGE